ncbi:hypothetical protein BDW59DRAFT_46476 [Aspergillus cavernicola]|uniref:RRM domain-containing protein n=1 Tax=Aspergillus cavernicola TaxID=176166 RepID=A0ABR4J2R8_9EURO
MSSFVGTENLSLVSLSQRPSSNELSTSDFVTISSLEYQRLLETSHHLIILKDSLLSGGLSQETLDLIIYGALPPSSDVRENDNEEPAGNQVSTTKYSKTCVASLHESSHNLAPELDDDEGALTDSRSDERDDYGESSRSTGSSSHQGEQRTVLIRGLPDRATHRDIVEAVKGGAILHLYLWARDHTASVSFVEETAAQNFLDHTRTYGLYVAEKRVEVLWNDRQFYLPPFVRAKISNGASRNLVIYNANPNISEGLIKDDLEHIHNLIVVSVKFKYGNAYISTNSVHNALFARSCMMSRLTYKGMKIGFYPDECTEPLAKIPAGPKRETPAPSRKPVKLPNRFHLLALDGSEDEDNEDHGGLGAGFNGNVCWTDNSVSA